VATDVAKARGWAAIMEEQDLRSLVPYGCLWAEDEEVMPVDGWCTIKLSDIKGRRFHIVEDGALIIRNEEEES
jgi:hypothetical protein